MSCLNIWVKAFVKKKQQLLFDISRDQLNCVLAQSKMRRLRPLLHMRGVSILSSYSRQES